ncbi:MAG: rhomboid family intramembrane serine protease [Bacteroidetes bacterium]|nr:rhomboid family intramembrane serine protease [Bacteroidota bacterium]
MIEADKHKFWDAFRWVFLFVVLFVGFYYLAESRHWSLSHFGVIPRDIASCWHILTIHFIHGSQEHLWNNVAAFSLLTGLLVFFYHVIAVKVFAWLWLISPVLLFFIGRDSHHIGASVLIYALTAFLITSGIIRRNSSLKRVALTVVFVYGYTVWYMFPIQTGISWEGHLSGFISGMALARIYRKQGPSDPIYQYEMEPELSDDDPFWLPQEDGLSRKEGE